MANDKNQYKKITMWTKSWNTRRFMTERGHKKLLSPLDDVFPYQRKTFAQNISFHKNMHKFNHI